MLRTDSSVVDNRTLPYCPLCCVLRLTKGKVALVDPEDWVWLPRTGWRAKLSRGGWYAYRINQIKGKSVYTYLHRLIMNTPKGEECHHGNGNGLDCRRGNLKNLTPVEHEQISRMNRIAKKRNFFLDN